MKTNISFGRYLRISRVSFGLTQEELAKEVRTSNVIISYLEKDQRFPSKKLMEELIFVLNLDKDILTSYIINHFTNKAFKYISTLEFPS